MRRNTFVLSLLAIALIVCAVVQPALAYFTANTEAHGAIPLNFYYKTEIKEDVTGLVKTVTIRNTGGDHPEYAEPVWVRAQVYSGVTYPLNINGGANWVAPPENASVGERWWYYSEPVQVGKETTGLVVAFQDIPQKDVEGHEFEIINVSVVYETARVYYEEDGSHGLYTDVDWTLKVDTGESTPNTSGS